MRALAFAVAFVLSLTLTVCEDVLAGQAKGARKRSDKGGADEGGPREGREGRKGRKALLGDSISFALQHDDELKLTSEQKVFLQALRKKLDAEREKEKEEAEIKDLQYQLKAMRRGGGKPEEGQALKQRIRELLQSQGEKWEERTNKELEKVLPKPYLEKLDELRGTPDALPENPFGQ